MHYKDKIKHLNLKYLTFFTRIALSLRARSWERILRSRFLRANTRFSEFLMWWVCRRFISRSIPLDCILRCINVKACSKLPKRTFTRMPLHCWTWWFWQSTEFIIWLGRVNRLPTCRDMKFISKCLLVCTLGFSTFYLGNVSKTVRFGSINFIFRIKLPYHPHISLILCDLGLACTASL